MNNQLPPQELGAITPAHHGAIPRPGGISPRRVPKIVAVMAAVGIATGCAASGGGEMDAQQQPPAITAVEAGNTPDQTATAHPGEAQSVATPIETGQDFIRALRGPIGTEELGYMVRHGDGGYTTIVKHPTLGEFAATTLGDTSVQKADSLNDYTIDPSTDEKPIGFVSNDIIVTSLDGRRKPISLFHGASLSGKKMNGLIDVPEKYLVPGKDLAVWPLSITADENGDLLATYGEIERTPGDDSEKGGDSKEADAQNQAYNFASTGRTYLVRLVPNNDPTRPYVVEQTVKLPEQPLEGHVRTIGSGVTHNKGKLIIYDSVKDSNDQWAWGYDIGAFRVKPSNVLDKRLWDRWTGDTWVGWDVWSKNPSLGQGAVLPAEAGVEGSQQIMARPEGTYTFATKEFAVIGDRIKVFESANPVTGWRVKKTINDPPYTEPGLEHLPKAQRAGEALEGSVDSYLASLFVLKDKDVVINSYNFTGHCPDKLIRDSVTANAGLKLAGVNPPPLGLEQCLTPQQ